MLLAVQALELAKNTRDSMVRETPGRKVPRRRVLLSASVSAADALYLDSWRRKIEAVGTMNYPTEAARRGLSGRLVLSVGISCENGNANQVRLLRSSGQAVLDEAARRIVHLASPFSLPPPAICKDVDTLEIVRTWQFSGSHHFESASR
jgi:protein TonB